MRCVHLYTQCNNFWKYGICPKRDGEKIKCQDCPSKDYTELRGKVILDHLQGIGHYIYPRFTRLVDLNQSEDKNPADYYRLIMQSELRNMQIISDTIDCVKRGRTPVVMTKYKEHAQKLYDMLQGSADHVFLLQGGKSLKERAAIREQMAAVRADESLVLVAIGQYVGEG